MPVLTCLHCAKPARRPAMCFVLNMDFTIFWSCVLMKYLKIQIPKLVVFIFALERARLLHTCNQPSPLPLLAPSPPSPGAGRGQLGRTLNVCEIASSNRSHGFSFCRAATSRAGTFQQMRGDTRAASHGWDGRHSAWTTSTWTER